jgi:hypothetical protein
MDDILIMQIVNSQQHLNNESFYAALCKLKPVLVSDIRFQITFVAIVKKNAEGAAVCKLLSKTADVGMPDPHQDGSFTQLVIQIPWI